MLKSVRSMYAKRGDGGGGGEEGRGRAAFLEEDTYRHAQPNIHK